VFLEIVKNLGFQELIIVDSKKHIFTNSEYEIVFEEVKNLGFFLEVEKLQEVEDNKITKEKENIRSFVYSLGLEIGEELNKGKPELMLTERNTQQKNRD